jgi:myo-inositol-1(or 4)-monophosphatase
MTERELAQLSQQVKKVAIQAGHFLRQELGKVSSQQIEEKSVNSLVSYVDRQAEEMIVAGLQQLLPSAGFLTEEATVVQKTAAQRWIIDPLDGTTNFLFGLPCFSVSIALELEDELVIGLVYEPNRDECFVAWRRGGAWLNDQPIRVRTNDQLAKSLLATGFPYYDYSRLPGYMKLFAELSQQTTGLRRWGSAAIDLAYTAAGRYDAYFEYSISPWDIAAGIVLVQEAGGLVSDFSGAANSMTNGEIVAGSNGIHPLLLEKVGQYL